jgi:hypothetical protein
VLYTFHVVNKLILHLLPHSLLLLLLLLLLLYRHELHSHQPAV